MFDFKAYNKKYLTAQGQNDAAAHYGVAVAAAAAVEGETIYRCIGVHHLTGEENGGNHHVFIDVLDQDGNRLRSERIAWTWHGRQPDEPARPVNIDKPDSEPGANIGLDMSQVVSVWVDNAISDVVANLHTSHADEDPGNTIGHHSFYVVFLETTVGGETEISVEVPEELLKLLNMLDSQVNDAAATVKKMQDLANL